MVVGYTEAFDQAGFAADGLTHDPTLRSLERIGESAAPIPEALHAAHPEIPWRVIIAARSRLVHGDRSSGGDTLWSIIRDGVPGLTPLPRAVESEHK